MSHLDRKSYHYYLLIFFSLNFLAIFLNTSNAQDLGKTIITDPIITRKCEAMLENRKLKIKQKNKLLSLIDFNRKLLKRTPPKKETIKKKLKRNFDDLRRELYYTRQALKFTDEDIIRKGCPGIVL